MQNAAGPVFLADCPTRLAVEIISDKWAVLVLFGLSQQPRRHGELADLIGGISRKVLTQTLRRLQQYGLVERHANAPRDVEYSLTDLGQTLIEPIEVLTNWARDHGDAIADFQEAAEAAIANPRLPARPPVTRPARSRAGRAGPSGRSTGGTP
jgi:DNA-binding HxlR family transcriptional regulator